jgi:hypothetical protein
VFAINQNFRMALIASAAVMIEVVILALNHMSCPLTAIAARHTDERQPNFDIYLPLWVARYNKQIFGPLYVVAALSALALWLMDV